MHKEPEHDRNQSNNQINAAEKKKREDSKEENLQPKKLSSKRISKELKSNQQIPNYETLHLSGSLTSRLIRGMRPMTPTTKKMIQWIGSLGAMLLANTTRTDPTTRTLLLMGISLSLFDTPLFM